MPSFKKIIHYIFAISAYWFYGKPAHKLIVIGVTGTKGKSTTARLIASVLESGGNTVGLLSTVELQIGKKHYPNDKKMTMLGRGMIQKKMKQMLEAGCLFAVIETSSEGILQYRHVGLDYDVVVFTNLGKEHIERHGSFEKLKADKGKIFAELKNKPNKIINGQKIKKIIIANIDDKNAGYYLDFNADEKYTFCINNNNSYSYKNNIGKILSTDITGSRFTVDKKDFKINLVGAFNVYNALAAITVGDSLGISYQNIKSQLAAVEKVAGRMEFLDAGQPFDIIIDYAHEPLSLNALFTDLRKISISDKKIIAVIGSDGGGRDKNKRIEMGKIAGKKSDFVIITDVNPYDEDPNVIAEMLASGARIEGKKDSETLFIENNRGKAIEKAISLAKDGDIVVLTAKGTEPFIAVANGNKIPWNDRDVAEDILKNNFKYVS